VFIDGVSYTHRKSMPVVNASLTFRTVYVHRITSFLIGRGRGRWPLTADEEQNKTLSESPGY